MEDIKDVTQFIFSRTERHDSTENRNQRALLKVWRNKWKEERKKYGKLPDKEKKDSYKNK